MTIWVDADSCPVRVREIICKAGKRLNCRSIFVANRPIPFPKSNLSVFVQTSKKSQSADNYIIENAVTGDLVVTRDIPFAKELLDAGIAVINDRGTIFTKTNITEKLSLRNFMYDLYAAGLSCEKISGFGKKEVQKFANALDTTLNLLCKEAVKESK